MNPLVLAFVASLAVAPAVDYGDLDISPELSHVTPGGIMVYAMIDGPCVDAAAIEDHTLFFDMRLFTANFDGAHAEYVFMTPDNGHAEIWRLGIGDELACLQKVLLRDEAMSELAARLEAGNRI